MEEYAENAISDLVDLLGGQPPIPVPADSPLEHLPFECLSQILVVGNYTAIMLAISVIPHAFPEKPSKKRYNPNEIRKQSRALRILEFRLPRFVDLVAYLPAADRIRKNGRPKFSTY